MSLEVSLELKQLIFGRLRSRNSASSANLGNVYLDYQKSLEKGSLLENRVFVLEREIQRLRSGEARNEDQGRARELEEKISKLQNELGASFKSIHEKSQLVLELREKALEDEKKVMDMSARMSKAQEECKEAMQEASRANLEISRLNEFIRQLNEEISSLRSIQEYLQKQIQDLSQVNRSLLDNILDIKQQQAAELNEVTEEVQILRQRMRNQEAQVVKQTNTNPLAPPSSVHDMIDSAWRLNKVASIPDQVCRIFRSGGGQISSVAFDGYGRHIVSGEMDRTVRLWKLSDEKECEKLIGPEKAIIDVDVSFDASMVLSAGHDPGIHLWSLKFNTSRSVLNGHNGKICSASFIHDSSSILSGSYDRTIKFWDITSSSCISTLNCVSSCNHVSLSSDGNTIASAHLDQHVRLWSLRSGELIENLEKVHSKLVSCVEFSRAGNLLVSCGRDSILKVFDTRTYRVLHELCDPEFTNPQNWSKFGFSSDGRYVVTGSGNGKVIIWDVEKGRRKRILTHHKEAVMSCQWSPSGKHILSGDKSGDLILWHESPDGKGSKH